MKNKLIYFLPILIIGLVSCGETKESEKMKPNLDPWVMSSYLNGETIYMQRCANCHQANGTGFSKLYPPLAGSDYLKANRLKAVSIIKNGFDEEITVNGDKYSMSMPNHKDLVDEDIADVITFICNAWGNQYGQVTVEEVRKELGR